MNDVFLNSYIAISQTIIGHPFDTLKTLKQVYNNKSVFNILQYIKKKWNKLFIWDIIYTINRRMFTK